MLETKLVKDEINQQIATQAIFTKKAIESLFSEEARDNFKEALEKLIR